MNDADRAAIRARLDAIAPWPWTLRNDNDAWGQRPLWVIEGGHNDPNGPDLSFEAVVNIGYKADAEFIAHAPTDIAALLDENERLRGALEVATQHPMQPLVIARDGAVRFKKNRLVRHLLDHGGLTMNDPYVFATAEGVSSEEQEQLAQLIGYSLSGYAELDYVTDASYERAEQAAAALAGREGVA